MTYKVHAFLNDRKVMNACLPHLPRLGDTVRLYDSTYTKVTEVIWCMDEDFVEGMRVNLRLEYSK